MGNGDFYKILMVTLDLEAEELSKRAEVINENKDKFFRKGLYGSDSAPVNCPDLSDLEAHVISRLLGFNALKISTYFNVSFFSLNNLQKRRRWMIIFNLGDLLDISRYLTEEKKSD